MKKQLYLLFMLMVCPIMMLQAKTNESVYNAVVAKDGSGKYTTVQAAIDAAPTGLKSHWMIYIKNGSYNELVTVPQNKPFIYLIGQDRKHTIIHYCMNVGSASDKMNPKFHVPDVYWGSSIHNPALPFYNKQMAVVVVEANDFYAENISFVNDYGVNVQNGPQALAMQTKGDRISFYNCNFRSFQDTWMTTQKNDAYRLYVKDCYIEGAVDYFYGGGDALLDSCTMYNVRGGSVIVAPCHKNAKYGYVFRDCIIDGNRKAADGKVKLGRPWQNSPKVVYINTTMRIPVDPKGWTDMGAIPSLFAEYGSKDTKGKLIYLSERKTDYKGRGDNPPTVTCRATITAEEASEMNYKNIILSKDNWDPRKIILTLKEY